MGPKNTCSYADLAMRIIGYEAVDAFTVSWARDYNWLFPPPYLVPRVLRHMSDEGEDGTLSVPEWHSAP